MFINQYFAINSFNPQSSQAGERPPLRRYQFHLYKTITRSNKKVFFVFTGLDLKIIALSRHNHTNLYDPASHDKLYLRTPNQLSPSDSAKSSAAPQIHQPRAWNTLPCCRENSSRPRHNIS